MQDSGMNKDRAQPNGNIKNQSCLVIIGKPNHSKSGMAQDMPQAKQSGDRMTTAPPTIQEQGKTAGGNA